MRTRRSFLATSAAVVLLAAAPRLGTAAEADAKEFIASLGTQALDALTVGEISDEERARRFRELFLANFDVPAIGRTVLGKYWRTASPEEQQAYLAAFEDFIVWTYAERFKRYSGETFQVTGIKEDRDGYATVQTTVQSPNGEDVTVMWRVRRRNEALKIVDVVVEGVSMVVTQQRDFASVVQQNGGSITALIEQLKAKVASKA